MNFDSSFNREPPDRKKKPLLLVLLVVAFVIATVALGLAVKHVAG